VKHHRPASRLRRVIVTTSVLLAGSLLLLAGQARAADGPGARQIRKAPGLVANPDCVLAVPARPLSARGLATPYRLMSAGLACTEANRDTSAFVQATILDPATGQVSVYDPLVITDGTTPAAPPVVPHLPRNAVVAIWTGFNGNVLRLAGPGAHRFVNFAQQAYDNSPAFFAALRASVAAGTTVVPPLGTASDGMPCPSTRDFSIVDQDQSDNIPVDYLFDPNGNSAQDTAANRAALGSTVIANGSDEKLVNVVDHALGCAPWTAPDLANPGQTASSGILQEEQAAVHQQAPVALVPALDPFVTRHGQPDLGLQNLYRDQVGQPASATSGDTPDYCRNMAGTGEPRLKADAATESAFPPPSTAPIGTNLANMLAFRFTLSWQLLGCTSLTGLADPISVTLDNNGIASAASYG
jgi:hypothetical protein